MAIAELPCNIDNLRAHARALESAGEIEAAIELWQEWLQAHPRDGEAMTALGSVLASAARYSEALSWLQSACDMSPDNVHAAYERAKILSAQKRKAEAIEAWRHLVTLNPSHVEALTALGNLLLESRHFGRAEEAFRRAADLDPNRCEAWLGLGASQLGTRNYTEALSHFRQALLIQPGSAATYCNMSLALAGLGRIEEAIDACRTAIFIEPGSAIPTFNMGTMLLSLGKFREGWSAYTFRHAMHGEKWLRDEAHAAPWMGEDLGCKSIVVLGEQGYGDLIQFARYLPKLCELGASVNFIAPQRLHRLFGTLPGTITLRSEIPHVSRFDYQCPLMTLPSIFEELGRPVPTRVPYLSAEPDRVAHWQTQIGTHGFKIGVVWRGNTYNDENLRSFPLIALRPLTQVPGVRLISLQIGDGTEQLSNLPAGMMVEQLGDDFDVSQDGFLDSAAVAELVDLIVTCDTSLCHLAGALGRPLWLALSEPAEWRWQRLREDSIWYPTARLFRQQQRGDWDGVFLRMAEALRELVQPTDANAKGPAPVPSQCSSPRVEVSWGELLDKISILEIKAERMTSQTSIANVHREIEHLKLVVAMQPKLPLAVERTRATLRKTNEKLWDLEDAIRACEAQQRFDDHFVGTARRIYALNDERARLKWKINRLMKSTFVEEKEYLIENDQASPPTSR